MNYVTAIFFFLLTGSGFAQHAMTDTLYMHYRDRFREDFVLCDTSTGSAIPVADRWPEKSCDDEWRMNRMCNGYGLIPGKKGILDWSDGTTYMGHYLAVLGSEYEIFRRAGKDVHTTVTEISQVVEALKRLDLAAEIKYGQPGKINGFLLRDDVTLETGRKIDSAFGCVKSGRVCRPGVADGNMLSQDQVIHLLFGSAFIIRLLPDTVKNIYSGEPVVKELTEQMDKILRYISREGWQIKDPDGNDVPLGYSAVGYSFGLVKAAKKLLGKSYGNATSFFAGRPLWQTLEGTPYQGNRLHNEVNLSMQLCIMSVAGPNDADLFHELCLKGNLQMFILAEAILNKHAPETSPDVFKNLLSDVPQKGVCDHSPGCENVKEWMSENRWFHPDARNGSGANAGGDFNGLDLMLLYNLYLLNYP